MEPTPNNDAFEALGAENRVTRTARMLDSSAQLSDSQRTDIVERYHRFIEQFNFTQTAVAVELGISGSTLSECVGRKYKGKTSDKHLVSLNNWMELTARRENVVRKRSFVEITVAREIIQVANIVAETCKMGVIFGPGQIGKTMTLQAIEGDARYGYPILITVDESKTRPVPITRELCRKLELVATGTFDALFSRVTARLKGTKRMLIFDEADKAEYRTLETIRQIHDATGCPVLFSGKPRIYEHLGLREVGGFSERLDQLCGRIIIKRDLMERTRDGKHPEKLYSLDDIRKLIKNADLTLRVTGDAEKWLQSRACALGSGGIGKAMICLYLAYKVAYVNGQEEITADTLDDVEVLTMGHEDAQRIAEIIADTRKVAATA